jgi:predicted nucleic acid-binding protein
MTTVDDVLFADTNVFLAATDRSRPMHASARKLLEEAARGDRHVALSGQVVREYLVVATRPVGVNGLGLLTEDALANIDVFTRPPFQFCDETEIVSQRLQKLIRDHGLAGKRIHDANIVALNEADFQSFEKIETVSLPSFLEP